jgi:hypothetical protein
MKAIKESLVKNIEHYLEYDKKKAIENILKSVFETILKLERSEFLIRWSQRIRQMDTIKD